MYERFLNAWYDYGLEPIWIRSPKVEISKLFSITYIAKQDM